MTLEAKCHKICKNGKMENEGLDNNLCGKKMSVFLNNKEFIFKLHYCYKRVKSFRVHCLFTGQYQKIMWVQMLL